MRAATLALLAAVELGGVFGAATATVEERGDQSVVVDLEVEVTRSVDSVVAHLAFGGERPLVLPLVSRGDGRFGIRTEVGLRNYQVVFEAVGRDGGLSEPVSLIQLGAQLTAPPATADDGEDDEGVVSPETARMGWLALALGAASLSALAFWALGGAARPGRGSSEEE